MKKSKAIAIILLLDAALTMALIFSCDNYVTPKEAALALSAALILALNTLRGKYSRTRLFGTSGILLLLWIVSQAASAAFGPHPIFSLTELRLPFTCFLIYLAIRTCDPDDNRSETNAFAIITAAAVLFSIHGIFQFFGHDFLPKWSRYADSGVRQLSVFSLFGNPNLLADFLAAALPAAAAVALLAGSKLKRALGAAAAVTIAVTLCMTGSRAAFAAAAAGLMALAAWRFSASRKKAPIFAFIGSAAVVAALIAIVTLVVPGKLGSVPMRIAYWKAAISIFKERPILGGGDGSFRLEYMNYQRQYFKSPHPKETERIALIEKPRYPHNEYLNELSDNGIIGALFFMLAIGSGIAAGLRAPPRGSIVSATWSASLVAVAVSSFFSFPIRIPTTGFIFPLVLAAADSMRTAQADNSLSNTPNKNLSFKLIFLILAIGASIALVYIQSLYMMSNVYLTQAKKMYVNRATDYALEEANGAISLTPNNGEALFTAGAIMLSTGDVANALPLLKKAEKVSSDPNLYINLGIAYAEINDMNKAIEKLTFVSEAVPADIKPKLLLAKYYEISHQPNKACEELIKAHSISPDSEAIAETGKKQNTTGACPYKLNEWFKNL